MMDTVLAFVEDGGMDLMNLNGRSIKQFASIIDPVLLQREAAAELVRAIIHIRDKYSEQPSEEPVPAIEASKPALPYRGTPSADEVWQYLQENGPQTQGQLREAFSQPAKIMSNRL